MKKLAQPYRLIRKKRPKAIGVILSYNCASLLFQLYRRIPRDVLDGLIVVDDGSTDDIKRVVKRLGIPLYSHAHLGYGGNIRFGLQTAVRLGADYIVELHGDGQYDPGVIPSALAKMREGYDLLLGTRFGNSLQSLWDGMPLIFFIVNRALSAIDRLVLGVGLSDFHTGFHVYSKRFVETINLAACSDNHLFSFEIVALARFHNLVIGQIPVRCDYKRPHTSMDIDEGMRFSLQTFAVLWKYMLAQLGIKTAMFHKHV